MSSRLDFTIAAKDGAQLACYEWPCDNPRAAVVIVHGLAEHARRYGRFAQALNDAGIAAMAMDLRGHGASIDGVKGFFAHKDGWKLLLEDVRQLAIMAKEKYPGVPLVLFGHSVGSLVSQAALSSYGDLFCAAVVSGVTVDIPLRRNIAPFIAWAFSLFSGRNNPAPLLDNITFGAYNKQFEPSRTKFDWLSRDTAEVDKYIADENCGFIGTGSMFMDLAQILLVVLSKRSRAKIPKDIKLFILSGEQDPTGMNGKAAALLEKLYKAVGLDAEKKVYEGCRHELLNEVNRDEVTQDIIGFIEKQIG